MDAIREFRVESNAYSAEFGRNYGGQINVLTKSGTNTLRGSASSSIATTRSTRATISTSPASPIHAQPVRRVARRPARENRLFYFGGYEGLRERLGKTIASFVPDDNARAGLLPDGPVAITDAVRPYLDAIPVANGPSIGGGLATHTFGFHQTLDENFFRDASTTRPARRTSSSCATPTTRREQRLPTDYPRSRARSSRRNQFLTAEYRNVRSERTLQTARFGYSRTRIGQNVEANLTPPLPPFVAGRGLVGDIDIGGMQRFGPQSSANLRLAQNVYSGQYD